MKKTNYEKILDEGLEKLKEVYSAPSKLQALIWFALDWEESMISEARDGGKSWEMIADELAQDLQEFEMKRLQDPEAAACYNKVLALLKDWDGED